MRKYIHIKEAIIAEISSGKLKIGDQLPVREELLKKYNVARPTLNRALSELINEKYLIAFRNRGTFVAERLEKVRIALVSTFQKKDLDLQDYQFNHRLEALKYIILSFARDQITFLDSAEVVNNLDSLITYDVVIWLMPNDSIISKLAPYKHKVIIVNRYSDELNFVSTNHRMAITKMTEYFIDRCENDCNLIYLDRAENEFIIRERREGFIDACESRGKFYRLCSVDCDIFDDLVGKLMDLKLFPDKSNIIISPSKHFTGAILRMAYLKKIQMGKDFNYSDFDNDDSLETAGIQVPSILQDYKQMGIDVIAAAQKISTEPVQKFIPFRMQYCK
jgi:DNA-binding transcriptional regulator YhcF (GntR family)